MIRPFSKILIANRGEIACRIIRTARRMGIATVAVYSDADARAMHVELADEAIHIGAAPASESYLIGGRIIAVAKGTGAEAIHPGYGFLSENPDFVEAIEAAGLIFIGPSASAIRAMGLKDAAKTLMEEAGVPVVPGYQGKNQDAAFLAKEAERIGYPVLIKARAGGGGKGMRKVDAAAGFSEALASAQREGQSAFGDPNVLIEKYVTAPRHIEVQIFGDNHGQVVHLFERDCSLQRRHQKVIEESPAPGMTDSVRRAMTEAAVKTAKTIGYSGAGTIEFIVDGSGQLREDGFWFMEMNTRLQVEHPVTEAITGVDLVEWQLRVAAGEALPLSQDRLAINGHALEARLYAEDPSNGFLPATGVLEHLSFDESARTDTGVRSGDTISPFYDPMIAKIITHGPDRDAARTGLIDALRGTHVVGTATNVEFLGALACNRDFAEGLFDTGLIERAIGPLTTASPVSDAHLFFASVCALGLDPDEPRSGWRLWGDSAHEVRMIQGGLLVECRLVLHPEGSVTMISQDRSVTFTGLAIDGPRMSASTLPNNARADASVRSASRGGDRLISVLTNGVAREFLLPDPRSGGATLANTGDAVMAPMTGMIVALEVSPGDKVEEGEKLGVIEAMKMETGLLAPRTGTVAEVHCAQGDSVEGGAVLITLEEEES